MPAPQRAHPRVRPYNKFFIWFPSCTWEPTDLQSFALHSKAQLRSRLQPLGTLPKYFLYNLSSLYIIFFPVLIVLKPLLSYMC